MRTLTISDHAFIQPQGMPYPDVVLEDSPAGYWPLTESAGTTALDLSGFDRHGTYNGSPSLASRSLNARLGDVCNFDGSTNFVSIAPGVLGSNTWGNDFVIEAWVVCDVLQPTQGIVAEQYIGGNVDVMLEVGIGISQPITELAAGAFRAGIGWTQLNSGFIIPTEVLTHIVMAYHYNEASLYINGAYNGQSVVPKRSADKGWTFGRGHNPATMTNFLDGAIGHVAMYDHLLSLDRISAHYAAGIA